MRNRSKETTLEEAIDEVARRARQLRISIRALVGSLMSWTALLIWMVVLQPIHSPLYGWTMPLAVAVVPILFWTVLDAERMRHSFDKLNALLAPGTSDIPREFPSSTIGPLLEATMTDLGSGDFLQSSAVLLVDLLQSVREGEEAVLTHHQRDLLHKILIKRYWDWFSVSAGAGQELNARRALRPAVVRALGVLGNRTSRPVLERFARETDSPELRESALLSLEQIRARMQDGADQLLRASAAPDRPDTLLRAVLSDRPVSTNAAELLRAETNDV